MVYDRSMLFGGGFENDISKVAYQLWFDCEFPGTFEESITNLGMVVQRGILLRNVQGRWGN